MKKKRIKVSSAKAKGRNLQKIVAQKIGELLDLEWGYSDDKLIQPRIMGQKGVDIVLRGMARENFKYDVECKSSEKWNLPKTIRQAKKNTGEGRKWLVVLKKKEFKNPVVVLDMNEFFYLLKQLRRYMGL
jgi:hypothetical protein